MNSSDVAKRGAKNVVSVAHSEGMLFANIGRSKFKTCTREDIWIFVISCQSIRKCVDIHYSLQMLHEIDATREMKVTTS